MSLRLLFKIAAAIVCAVAFILLVFFNAFNIEDGVAAVLLALGLSVVGDIVP